eukprot:jgi/Psemu1/10246/gm1.10246_g
MADTVAATLTPEFDLQTLCCSNLGGWCIHGQPWFPKSNEERSPDLVEAKELKIIYGCNKNPTSPCSSHKVYKDHILGRHRGRHCFMPISQQQEAYHIAL